MELELNAAAGSAEFFLLVWSLFQFWFGLL